MRESLGVPAGKNEQSMPASRQRSQRRELRKRKDFLTAENETNK